MRRNNADLDVPSTKGDAERLVLVVTSPSFTGKGTLALIGRREVAETLGDDSDDLLDGQAEEVAKCDGRGCGAVEMLEARLGLGPVFFAAGEKARLDPNTSKLSSSSSIDSLPRSEIFCLFAGVICLNDGEVCNGPSSASPSSSSIADLGLLLLGPVAELDLFVVAESCQVNPC